MEINKSVDVLIRRSFALQLFPARRSGGFCKVSAVASPILRPEWILFTIMTMQKTFAKSLFIVSKIYLPSTTQLSRFKWVGVTFLILVLISVCIVFNVRKSDFI